MNLCPLAGIRVVDKKVRHGNRRKRGLAPGALPIDWLSSQFRSHRDVFQPLIREDR